jgi:hypothetical protein
MLMKVLDSNFLVIVVRGNSPKSSTQFPPPSLPKVTMQLVAFFWFLSISPPHLAKLELSKSNWFYPFLTSPPFKQAV